MLRSIKELFGYNLKAIDGKIGRCKDFLFDDMSWTIRYMVADTGTWLPGKRVIISPISLDKPDWTSRLFPIKLTVEQIETSPDLDEHAPVSRQYETIWNKHYGYLFYWDSEGVWGPYHSPEPLFNPELVKQEKEGEVEEKDEYQLSEPHLRSVDEVRGYYIKAKNGDIGHVEDFIIDDKSWIIRYMIVDTRNWLPGRKVIVSPQWIETIEWAERTVSVTLNKEAIENAPEFEPDVPVNRVYESRLYDFYGRPKYWEK